MNDKEIAEKLSEILARLSRIEYLLNKNDEEYTLIDSNVIECNTPKQLSESDASESDLSIEETYESDSEMDSVDQRLSKLYLLTPDIVEAASAQM